MNTFKHFFCKPEIIPASTVWYNADLSEARGKQEINVLAEGRELNGGERVLPLKGGNNRLRYCFLTDGVLPRSAW
jgi:hypothetical protein